MMDHVFCIRNWSELFETGESRKVARAMDWVKMRTKHDGRSYRRVTRMRNANRVLLGWYIILQVSAKMPARGVLADLDGPLDAKDLADKTGIARDVFQTALGALEDPEIGWIEKREWEKNLPFWDNVARLDLMPGYYVARRDQTGRDRIKRDDTERTGKGKTEEKEESAPGGLGPNGTDLDQTGPNRTDLDQTEGASGKRGTGEERRLHKRKAPPIVPQGGTKEAKDLIRNPDVAKRLICEKILNGKDPGVPWSYEAQERLSSLLPIPLSEILVIGRYRATPKSDDVPELRDRRDPITETTLMKYWGDELQRAREFEKKYWTPEATKEPPRWREFFRWQYDNPAINLPSSFELLDPDQKKEYGREFEKFEEATTA